MTTRSALRRKKATPPTAVTPPAAATPSDFATAIARIAIAQICRSVGYRSVEAPALETLTRVSALYMETLAATAASYSDGCNRTQSNAFDVGGALNDLNSAHGFPGAAGAEKGCGCLLKSGVLKELERFVEAVDEIPFAKPIPKASGISIGFQAAGSAVRGKHIPDWLPDFPDESTYKEEIGGEGRDRGREFALWEKRRTVDCGDGEGDGGGAGVNRNRKSSEGELVTKRKKVSFQIGQPKKKVSFQIGQTMKKR